MSARPSKRARGAASPTVASGVVPIGVLASDGGRSTRVEVRAQPGARRSGFAGFWNDRVKLAVSAPPEDGRANEELVALVAEIFGVRASAVQLVAGSTSRAKSFHVALDHATACARFAEFTLGADR